MASVTRKKAQSMPNTPAWRYHTSTSELKKDVLVRIAVFFEHEINRKKFSAVYTDYKDGTLKKKSPTIVCDTAIDILKLYSVKIGSKKAVQLSKKLMVLQPFDVEMERPQLESPTSSEGFHHIEPSKEVQLVESDISTQTPQDIPNEPGNNEMIGQVAMVSVDIEKMLDDKLLKLEERIRQERKDDQAQMRSEMKVWLEECFANSFRLNMEENVMKVIRDTGHSVISDMMNEMKPNIIEKVQEMSSEAIENTIQGFNTTADQKRNLIIADIQVHTDKFIQQLVHIKEGALEDVNEEAAQAISDVQSVTEQSRVEIQEECTNVMKSVTAPVTPTQQAVKPAARFKDVDISNLHVNQPMPPSYGGERQPRYQKQQSSHRQHSMHSHNDHVQGSVQNVDQQWQHSHYAVSGFHKHFRARMQNDNHILNFYQQLHVQGPKYGIHVKKLQDIYPNDDLCPSSYSKASRDDMARTIYQKMQDEDCVSIGYTKAQSIIAQYAHISDGFKVMEQLLRFVHPNLQQVTANTYEVPRLSQCKGDIYEYGALVMNYILRQEISLRKYSPQEQAIMFLNNMDDRQYFDAKNRALAEIRHTSSTTGTFDPNLNIESLPTTISQYQMQINGNNPDENRRSKYNGGHIRSMFAKKDDDIDVCGDTEDENVPWIRAMGVRKDFPRRDFPKRRFYRKDNNFNNYDSMKQCTACGRWDCQETKCQFVAKVQLAVNYIRKHSSKTAKLAEEYLRTNSKRTKMSTIRTLTSFASNGQCDEVDSMRDEELLHHFDVDIPMEDIDSSGNNEE